MIDRVTKELWTEVCDTVQEAVIKIIPKKKKCKKARWLSEEALQIAEKRKYAEGLLGKLFCLFAFIFLVDGIGHCLLYSVTNLHP